MLNQIMIVLIYPHPDRELQTKMLFLLSLDQGVAGRDSKMLKRCFGFQRVLMSPDHTSNENTEKVHRFRAQRSKCAVFKMI